jgi:Excreted virulence factor EspC, type VII ESX diderm
MRLPNLASAREQTDGDRKIGDVEVHALWLTFSVVSTQNVAPEDLITFSDRHREVGEQVDSALGADASIVAAMPAAYGTVGAVFTAAVVGFEATLHRTGAALVGDYRRISKALDIASASYASTDQVSGAAIARSGASVATEVSAGHDAPTEAPVGA